MSSIYKNTTGFWYYQAYDWESGSGKKERFQKSLGTKDEAEALRRQKEFDRKRERTKRSLSKKERLLHSQVEKYLDYRNGLVAKGSLSRRTLEIDQRYLTRFWRHIYSVEGEVTVTEITHSTLERFLDDGVTNGIVYFDGSPARTPLSHETVRGYLRHVKAFFSRLVKEGTVDQSPFAKFDFPQRKARRDLITPTGSTWIHLRDFLREEVESLNCSDPTIILHLMVETGCRVGEIRTMKFLRTEPYESYMSGIHENYSILAPECDLLEIFWKRHYRAIPVDHVKTLLQSLREQRESSQVFVFKSKYSESPLGYNAVKRKLRSISKEMGLHSDITTHSLRRGFISFQVDSGSSISTISEYVGHSSSYITEHFYKKTDVEHLRNFARNRLH